MLQAEAERHVQLQAQGPIVEFPLTTLQLLGWRSPFGGGAYLRILPYWYTRWGIRFLNTQENRPVCVYVHPWEFDAEQPRMTGSITSRIRHYVGLRSTPAKFRKLIRDFEFLPLGTLIDQALLGQPHSSGLRSIA